MLSAITAGTMMLTSLGVPAAPPPDYMTIAVVAANGSGCPKGSAVVTVSPDNKAFTVAYSEFLAQVGPEAKPTDFRKQCQLALDIKVPEGYTYAVASTDYRGYARLEKGASATETAFYYFQGESRTSTSQTRFDGFWDKEWQVTDKVPIQSMSWSPCGEKRYLNINTELRVLAGKAPKGTTSFITMDSSDGNLETIYRVSWQKCPA